MSACATCGAETVQVRRKDEDAVILNARPSAEFLIFDTFNDTVAVATDVLGGRSLEYLDQCEARRAAIWREHVCGRSDVRVAAALLEDAAYWIEGRETDPESARERDGIVDLLRRAAKG